MKLMVIDGNSIINRAFYGVRPLSTRDGLPTNAVYGFLNILLKLLDEEGPDALCVAFDLRAPTFRHLAYEGYKAQRKPMPEDLVKQVPLLKEVLDALNIPRYELEGWEADDLIGTIAEKDTAAGWDTVVVTGDKDSLQLITDRVTVKLVTTRMGQTTTKNMTPDAFRAEYGFDPIHIIDLKALMGDASDNIPGVRGIGEKTAMDLIQRFNTVACIYEKLPDLEGVKPGALKRLDEGREQAELSYDLATIRRDAPLAFAPENALRREPDRSAAYELFLRLEFAKLIEKLGLTSGSAGEAGEGQTQTGACESEVVSDRARMEELLALWRQRDHVSLLTLPELSGVCVEWGDAHCGRAALCFPDRLDCYNDFLRGIFAPDIRKVTHRAKDLMGELLAEGLSLEGFVFDTELAAYLLAPTDGSYELDKLSVSYFNFETAKPQVYRAPGAFSPLLAPEDAQTAGKDPYAGTEDREATAAAVSGPMGAFLSHTALVEALYGELSRRLEELGLHQVYYDIELPLCPVLAEMERTGVLVDRKALARFGEMLETRLREDETAIYDLAGETFNINSTQQMGHILFDKLGLPPVKKTKTGYSTNAEVLEKLRGKHPVIDAILEYRQYAKLKSTYVDGLTKVIAPDGRIHTSFQNTVTATGRLSSTEPNLQNIPVRTELGAQLRNMFVSAPGCMLVDADYSQIELRLLAHIAGDKAMQEAFRSGADIHTATAAQVFGVPPEEVSHEMRRRAKAVNFGIVYGISDFSLAQDIGVSRAEAREYMDRYFATFRGVRAYMDRVVAEAKEQGWVATLMGRRRWLPELKSSNFNLRSFGERVALNMPIQGTAADVIKLAMIRVWKALKAEGLKAKLILQVHDELIVECPEEETEQVKEVLTREMEDAVDYAVPMRADSAAGKSWGEAKE